MSHEQRDDGELLSAWRLGEVDAGDELLRRYFVPVYRFFVANLRASGRASDPEDLAQRTFEACIDGRDRVQADFRAYLFGVARRLLYGEWKRRQQRGDFVAPSQAGIYDVRTSPSAAVARHDQQMLVVKAIEGLPLEFRAVLERFYWEDQIIPDIARELGIAVGTVKSRLFRGKALLRDRLTDLQASAELRESVIQRLEREGADEGG